VFAHQKFEKRGFAAPVSPDEAEFPAGVDGKGRVFEDIVVAAFIMKGQVVDAYLRHMNPPVFRSKQQSQTCFKQQKKNPSTVRAHVWHCNLRQAHNKKCAPALLANTKGVNESSESSIKRFHTIIHSG